MGSVGTMFSNRRTGQTALAAVEVAEAIAPAASVAKTAAEDLYAALQPDPEAVRAAGAKMMAADRAGHRGDIVGRTFDYEK